MSEVYPVWGSGRPVRKILMRGGYQMLVDLRLSEQREAWLTGTYEEPMVDRHGWPSEEVDVVPLDDWSHRLGRCDVMIVDVEGADLLVLQGGGRTIEKFRPVILAEFKPTGCARSGNPSMTFGGSPGRPGTVS